jgi:hypothetical protein
VVIRRDGKGWLNSLTKCGRMAEDQQAFAVGIVLSGNGSDGAVGIGTIKEQMGLVMAQDPQSARCPGMPARAIAARHLQTSLRKNLSALGPMKTRCESGSLAARLARRPIRWPSCYERSQSDANGI